MTNPGLARGRPLPALLCLVVAAGLAGCAEPADVAPEELDLAVAPVGTAARATGDPREAAAREHTAAGRYAAAQEAFEELSRFAKEPEARAEFLFLAAEAALGAGEHYDAYELYRELIRRYPATPRYPAVIERLFLIGRLYCQGRASKPSLLLGLSLRDREFGIDILERFQQARERHELADDALHYVAVAREALGEEDLAIESWQRLGDEYPESEWAEAAEYRAALAFLELSDGVDYDKRPLLTGLERLRTYVDRHPTGDYVAEARQRIAALEEELAAHRLGVADYYLRKDRIYSARIVLGEIQREYPATESAAEAGRLAAELPDVPLPPPPEPDDLEALEEIPEAPPPPPLVPPTPVD